MQAIGLPELITGDLPAYEAHARHLAAAPGKLEGLRERLAINRGSHPLFDAASRMRIGDRCGVRVFKHCYSPPIQLPDGTVRNAPHIAKSRPSTALS